MAQRKTSVKVTRKSRRPLRRPGKSREGLNDSLDGQEGADVIDLEEIKLVRLGLTEVISEATVSLTKPLFKTLIENIMVKPKTLELHRNKTHSTTTARDL